MLARRTLIGAAAAAALSCAIAPAYSQTVLGFCAPGTRPDLTKFRSGDLIWPAVPIQVYASAGSDDLGLNSIEWEKLKSSILREPAPSTEADRKVVEFVNSLDYLKFRRYFADDAVPQQIQQHGALGIGVSHVGVIEVAPSGEIFIIEAMPALNVHRIPYRDWEAGRKCEKFWHGRIVPAGALAGAQEPTDGSQKGELMVTAAKAHLGKPYSLANLRIDDLSSFYCSKLVWSIVFEVHSISIDGRSSTGRRPWVSPAGLRRSPHVRLLHIP